MTPQAPQAKRTLPTHSLPLAGTYPHITKRLPKIGGVDNLGPGETQHGESFLLKSGGVVGASEFIGASLCGACGIPYCTPCIVTLDLPGGLQHVFGSRMELGLKKFDQTNLDEWSAVVAACTNPSIFSAMLAIDLALGNDDRHWGNWLVQDVKGPNGENLHRLRALDFSRSWPVDHPAQHPLRHKSINTWDAARYWETLGVAFDQTVFFDTCVKIHGLTSRWLRIKALDPLRGVFLTQTEIDQFCAWWDSSWKAQVVEVIDSIENGERP